MQNYLVANNAKGQLTPLSSISKQKQEELEKEALTRASENARANAEAKAALFGAEIGDAISISDTSSGGGFPTPIPYLEDAAAETSEASLPFQPGQDEYTLTVYVTYELK